jgi:hypothetical protein
VTQERSYEVTVVGATDQVRDAVATAVVGVVQVRCGQCNAVVAEGCKYGGDTLFLSYREQTLSMVDQLRLALEPGRGHVDKGIKGLPTLLSEAPEELEVWCRKHGTKQVERTRAIQAAARGALLGRPEVFRVR